MAEAELKAPSSGSLIVNAIVGVVLMVGGTYLSKSVKIPFLESLEHQGILLDPGKTLAVIGVFLILFKVLDTFYFTPLRDAINERNNSLEATFTEAATLRSEMDGLKSEYESRIAETEASARAEIQAEINRAQELRRSLEAEARSKADEMTRRASEEIAAEKARALGDIRLHVANLTLQATEKLLNENMDNDRNRRLIDEFLDKVEVPTA
ncbi:MAG: F0F1 ATP synthase subunit B [Fimbriimonadaceae bacterium]